MNPRWRWAPLLIAFAVYLPLAAAVTWGYRDQLNVDGVAYLRIAGYYAAHDFDRAVTGYWAPLLSWLLVPWHMAGADTILGTYILNIAAGGVFIAATHHLGRLLRLSDPFVWAVPIGAGLLVVTWLPRGICADVLFAAMITVYFTRSYRMSRRGRPRDALTAGFVAGFAYLTKYYALPFFFLHHTLSIILVARRELGWRPTKAHVQCWFAGAVGCLLVAGPWLLVLSAKYDQPTFSTTGRIVHSLAGPDVPEGGYWPMFQLEMPREGRITTWENPDEMVGRWPRWSPFDGLAGIVHQLRLFLRNGREIARCLFGADGLGILYGMLLLTPLLACVPLRNPLRINPWQWRWALLGLAAFLSGLMLVFAGTPRYYLPLQGLLLVLAGKAARSAARLVACNRDAGPFPLRERVAKGVLACILVYAAALPNCEVVRQARGRPGADLRRIATELRGLGFEGPLASNHWHNTVILGYYLNTPCVGVPRPDSPAQIRRRLEQAGVRTFLFFDGEAWPPGAALLRNMEEGLGTPRVVLDEGKRRVIVFELEEPRQRTPAS